MGDRYVGAVPNLVQLPEPHGPGGCLYIQAT